MPLAPTEHVGAEVFNAVPPEAALESTAVAGEVLSDLATLSQMDDQQAGSGNWALDDTFTPDAPAAPTADENPFGALDTLLADEEVDDEDRGSVLKFLRRD